MVAVYLAAIVAANLTVAWWGPAWSIVNAFLFVGLDLTARDRLHARWSTNHLALRMGALIAAGSGLSWLVNRDAGRIGFASLVAFAVASSLDAFVFHRTGSITRSNIAGAAVDSVLFPTLAFGALLPWVVLGQFAAKVGGGEMWRRVLAHSEKPAPTTRPSPGTVPSGPR